MTTNLKTKNNQNCQKIELYGSPKTKELKKKHLFRLAGWVEIGSWGWQTRWSYICMWISQEEQLEIEKDHPTQDPVQGNKTSKPPAVKTCGCCGGERNSQPHRRVHWRNPQGPRTYTSPPTWESAPEREQSTCRNQGKWLKAVLQPSTQHYSLSDPSHTKCHSKRSGLLHPGEYLGLLPLQHIR